MRLRDARRSSGLTQYELAEKLGVSQPLVCDWESGKDPIPDGQKQKLVKILGPLDFSDDPHRPLNIHEQRQMFTAMEIAARRIGYQPALELFATQDSNELRKLTDLVLRNAGDDELLLPPGVSQ